MKKMITRLMTLSSILVISVSALAQVEIKNPKYFRTSDEGFPGAVVGNFRISCDSDKDLVCTHLGFSHAIDYSCKNKKFGSIGGRVATAIDCGLNFIIGGESGMCDGHCGSNG